MAQDFIGVGAYAGSTVYTSGFEPGAKNHGQLYTDQQHRIHYGDGALLADRLDTDNGSSRVLLKVGDTNATSIEIGRDGYNTTIKGNLRVEGTTFTNKAETVLIDDNFSNLNYGYQGDSPEAGGIVINVDPDTNVVTGTFADVSATTQGPPPVLTLSSVPLTSFSPGDLVSIVGTQNSDGLYEVSTYSHPSLTLKTSSALPFVQTGFGPSESGLTGQVAKVAVSSIKASSGSGGETIGDWYKWYGDDSSSTTWSPLSVTGLYNNYLVSAAQNTIIIDGTNGPIIIDKTNGSATGIRFEDGMYASFGDNEEGNIVFTAADLFDISTLSGPAATHPIQILTGFVTGGAGASGVLTLTSGDNQGTGDSGNVFLKAGGVTTGTPGNVTIEAGSASGAATDGGDVYIDGGDATGTGSDGVLHLGSQHSSSVDLGASGGGTPVRVVSSTNMQWGSFANNEPRLHLASGALRLEEIGTAAAGTDGFDIQWLSGNSGTAVGTATSGVRGGVAQYFAGSGSAAGALGSGESPGIGGQYDAAAGKGGGASDTYAGALGGDATFKGGAGGDSFNVAGDGGVGGDCYLEGGQGGTTSAGSSGDSGDGGDVYVRGGRAGLDLGSGVEGVGGDTYVTGGGAGTGTAGHLYLRGGPSATGSDGNIYIADSQSPYVELGNTTDYPDFNFIGHIKTQTFDNTGATDIGLQIPTYAGAPTSTSGNLEEGDLVWDSASNDLYAYSKTVPATTWVKIGGASGAATTLDSAYDGLSGSGSGRMSNVDSNSVYLDVQANATGSGAGNIANALEIETDLDNVTAPDRPMMAIRATRATPTPPTQFTAPPLGVLFDYNDGGNTTISSADDTILIDMNGPSGGQSGGGEVVGLYMDGNVQRGIDLAQDTEISFGVLNSGASYFRTYWLDFVLDVTPPTYRSLVTLGTEYLYVDGPQPTTSGQDGYDIYQQAIKGYSGTGTTESGERGGHFWLNAGDGGDGGDNVTGTADAGGGGTMIVSSGDGGDGTATVNSGNDAGAGGYLFIQSGEGGAGNAYGSGGNGGTFFLNGGDGGTSGSGTTGGAGGPLNFIAGDGGAAVAGGTGGLGGTINISGGDTGQGAGTEGAFGGSISIAAGDTAGTTAGAVAIRGGASTTGTSGHVLIEGGDTTSGTVGNVYIRGGDDGGSIGGDILIGDTDTSNVTIGNWTDDPLITAANAILISANPTVAGENAGLGFLATETPLSSDLAYLIWQGNAQQMVDSTENGTMTLYNIDAGTNNYGVELHLGLNQAGSGADYESGLVFNLRDTTDFSAGIKYTRVSSKGWFELNQNTGTDAVIGFKTPDTATPAGTTNELRLQTGAAPVGVSTTGDIHLTTGGATSGNSGDIYLTTGVGGASRGDVFIDANSTVYDSSGNTRRLEFGGGAPSSTRDPGSMYVDTTAGIMYIYQLTVGWVKVGAQS